MKIKPMEVTPVGIGFALHDEKMNLVIFDRDRAVVEAQLKRLQFAEEKSAAEKTASGFDPDAEDIKAALDKLTYIELKALAKEQEIPGYHKMSADNLKAALIEKLDASDDDDQDDQDDQDDEDRKSVV